MVVVGVPELIPSLRSFGSITKLVVDPPVLGPIDFTSHTQTGEGDLSPSGTSTMVRRRPIHPCRHGGYTVDSNVCLPQEKQRKKERDIPSRVYPGFFLG